MKAAEQSVQLTCGSRRHFQAFFWLRAFSTSQTLSTPTHTQLTQTVGCPNPEPAEIEWQLDDGYRDVAPVGSFPAGTSPYGAWDMAGNVLEWVSDWYTEGYYSVSPYENPVGPADGSRHPIRGGSWWSGRAGLRPAARASKSLDYSSDMVGFRCAVDNP